MTDNSTAPAPAEASTTTTISQPGNPTVQVDTKLAAPEITAREIALIRAMVSMPNSALVKTLIVAICVFSGYIAFQARDSIVGLITASVERSIQAQHAGALHVQMKQQEVLGGLLTSVRSSLNAGRASVFQFHNGTNSLKGVPFMFMSETAESIADGVSNEIVRNQHLPYLLAADWMPRLTLNECVAQDSKKANSGLAPEMRRAGTTFAYLCPFFINNDAREPAGFVSVSYIGNAKPVSSQVAFARLRDAATVVGRTLSQAVISDK